MMHVAKYAICAIGGAAVGAALVWRVRIRDAPGVGGAAGAGSAVGDASARDAATGAVNPATRGILPRHTHVHAAPDGTWWSTEQDAAKRHPRYVVELLTAESVQRRVVRAMAPTATTTFRLHGEIPARWQAHPSQYTRTGYDRGHLVPAADHRTSLEELAATFAMTNVAPQAPGLNRGYWARLEAWLRNMAAELPPDRAMTIVSGPAYLPRWTATGWRVEHDMLGPFPQLVGVPTHFFKVVAVHDAGPPLPTPRASRHDGADGAGAPSVAVAAFLLPNASVPHTTPLSAFVVPLHALEAIAGLDIATALPGVASGDVVGVAEAEWQPSVAVANLQRELHAPPDHVPPAVAGTRGPQPAISRVLHLCAVADCVLQPTHQHQHVQGAGPSPGAPERHAAMQDDRD
jgi:DNA/RNA endonuclease G (NUC1)